MWYLYLLYIVLTTNQWNIWEKMCKSYSPDTEIYVNIYLTLYQRELQICQSDRINTVNKHHLSDFQLSAVLLPSFHFRFNSYVFLRRPEPNSLSVAWNKHVLPLSYL